MLVEDDVTSEIRVGKLSINLDSRIVTACEKPLHLTRKEYDILKILSLHKDIIVTREMLLDHLYGGAREPEMKIIDVFICKLRKKLSEAASGNHYIETIWGRGYVMRDPKEMDL